MSSVDALAETLHRTMMESHTQGQGQGQVQNLGPGSGPGSKRILGESDDSSMKEKIKINEEKASEITKTISMICKCAYIMSELVSQRKVEDEV